MTDSSFSLVSVAAQTHPAGYAFHKYWARKPHNVVNRVLTACGVGPGDVVLDPFCGSGVPLSEAATLGASCIGFDVNPIAVELTRATLNPPEPEPFRRSMAAVMDDLEACFGRNYQIGGQPVRYAVHATVVECEQCRMRVSSNEASREGRKYSCPQCKLRLYFNLENLVATRILRAVLADGSSVTLNEEVDEAARDDSNASAFNHEFLHNARILAFRGLCTRQLFTARNFRVLASFAERVPSLPPPAQMAARLTLTAAAAQCSRLIAYRNGLSTGGPAWTVPGFWVPPLHLETNPLAHIRARIERTYKGLRFLRRLKGRGPFHKILQGDSGELVRSAVPSEIRVKVVFLDPPYGDSVPYLEFSAMWNSFLGHLPDPSLDIAVSDRARGDGTWEKYGRDIAHIVASLRPVMLPEGSLVVTFNNKDLRAWQAFLSALQVSGYRCDGAFYQHPAVVSAKAQLANDGSYVGDFYCVFRSSRDRPSADLSPIRRALAEVLELHQVHGLDDDGLQRVAVAEWLRQNIDARALSELPGLLAEARRAVGPSTSEGAPGRSFAEVALSTADEMVEPGGSLALSVLAAELHRRYSRLGVPSVGRLKEVLQARFAIEGGVVKRYADGLEVPRTNRDRRPDQLCLFREGAGTTGGRPGT